MALFIYKGIQQSTGTNTKGKIDADSGKEAKIKLKKQGILVVEIHESVVKSKTKSNIRSLFESVPIMDIAVMTRQFATLQKAGIPLDESLKALSEQVENELLKTILTQVKEEVNKGTSLAKALGSHPKVFTELYTCMIDAGENSGALDLVLSRLSDFTEASVKLKNSVVNAMMYPLIMICISFLIIFFLFIKVLPQITDVLAGFDIPLPIATRFVMWLSNFLQDQWFYVILTFAAIFILFRRWKESKKGKLIWHAFILKIPVVGEINRKVAISMFTKTLSTLLANGVPVVNSLEIVKNVIGNVVIRGIVEEAKISVVEGKPLAKPLADSGQFPPLVTHMIQTGEQTGDLENMLMHVSDAYDNEVQHKISSLTSIIEPVMIVLMAGIIVLVVVAILVPMFDIFSSVGK